MGMCNVFEQCFWFEGGEKRNGLASMLAGLLVNISLACLFFSPGTNFTFFLGWWLVIDTVCVWPGSLNAAHHVCGILGTLSLFMVNAVTNAQVRGDAYTGGCMGSRGARIWLFVGFVLGFASVIAAVWIMIAEFATTQNENKWAGVSLVLQNVFIFVGSVVFKFGRSEESWGI